MRKLKLLTPLLGTVALTGAVVPMMTSCTKKEEYKQTETTKEKFVEEYTKRHTALETTCSSTGAIYTKVSMSSGDYMYEETDKLTVVDGLIYEYEKIGDIGCTTYSCCTVKIGLTGQYQGKTYVGVGEMYCSGFAATVLGQMIAYVTSQAGPYSNCDVKYFTDNNECVGVKLIDKTSKEETFDCRFNKDAHITYFYNKTHVDIPSSGNEGISLPASLLHFNYSK